MAKQEQQTQGGAFLAESDQMRRLAAASATVEGLAEMRARELVEEETRKRRWPVSVLGSTLVVGLIAISWVAREAVVSLGDAAAVTEALDAYFEVIQWFVVLLVMGKTTQRMAGK